VVYRTKEHNAKIAAALRGKPLSAERREKIRVSNTPSKKEFEKIFWNRVLDLDPTTGCMLWGGSSIAAGYGKIAWKGEGLLTHRISWELNFGPIPKGLCVCHHCDIPPCINPYHLFVGTYSDNERDKLRKGRGKL